jgi:outer membrane biosynthesis protein TonB
MKVIGVIRTAALFLLLGTSLPALAQEEHHEESAKPAQQQDQSKPAQHEEQTKPQQQKEEVKPENQQAQPTFAKEDPAAKAPVRAAQPKPTKQTTEAKSTKPAPQPKPAEHSAQANSAKEDGQAKSARQAPKTKHAQRTEVAKSAKQEGRAHDENQQPAKQQAQEQQGNSSHGQHVQRTPAEEQRQHAVPALRLSSRSSGRISDDHYRANFGESHVFVINEPVMVGGYSRFQHGGYWFGFNNQWPVGWYYTDDVYVEYFDGGYYFCNPYYPGARVGISVVI